MGNMDELASVVKEQIIDATKKGDLAKAASLLTIAQDIEKVRKEIVRVEQAIRESKDHVPQYEERSVIFEIPQGAINQNYLPVKEIKRNNLIPTDGKEFTVETSVGLSFQTKISDNGHWLAARGKTRELFVKAGVKAGDKVRWSEIGPYRYHLSKL